METQDGREHWQGSVSMTLPAHAHHSLQTITQPYEVATLDLTLYVASEDAEGYLTQTLGTLLDAVSALEFSYEIFIIDDASSDNSAEEARRFINDHPDENIVLRVNPYKKGLAQNYADAAFLGKGRYMRMVYGDSGETMETHIDILRALGEADILIPYYIESLHGDLGEQRMPHFYARVLNAFTKYRLKDYSLSPVHLRHNVMRWLGAGQGYGFQVELLCRLLDLGFTYKQMPSRSIESHPSRMSKGTLFYNFISIGQTVCRILFRRLSSALDD